ncbi:MAG: hypothetical protein ACRC33_10355 [Gemmataceae bacterium]
MKQAQWRTARDPYPMLQFAEGRASQRKLRLFACACCRRFHELLPTDEARRALDAAERAADGDGSFADMAAARRAFRLLTPGDDAAGWASNCAHCAAVRSAKQAAWEAYSTSAAAARTLGYADDERHYAGLLRDVLGDPFPPATLAAVSPAAAGLALAAYRERLLPSGHLDGARLAVLSDALEEAGADAAVLGHLRSPGPHVRGCWAVDLVLGRG